MLNPNDDRLDYGEILAPPAGYDLDFAVGTTYSLDLDALVGASLAMGLSEETDSEFMNNPLYLLEALRITGDKVALFCEGGQIHMPKTVTKLYIMLEKMVFSVKTVKQKGSSAYPSFHPKFWLIRYRKDSGEKLYRVVVLSRNLTFDRSWDVTYFMDGHYENNATDKNEPMCDFLRYLIRQIPCDDNGMNENGMNKMKLMLELVRELPNVWFKPQENEFYDYEFIPNGVKDAQGKIYCFSETSLFTDTFHEILIMSPFVSGGIIRDFNDRNKKSQIQNAKYMLFTRKMSLGKLSPGDVSNFEIFTMKDNVIDGETAISEKAADAQKQDIHAKIYMVRKDSDTKLYLGSLNASHNAVYENIEFMLCLMAKDGYLNMDKLSASLFCGGTENTDNPFQKVTLGNAIVTEDEEKNNVLCSVIKAVDRSEPRASVRLEDDGDCFSVNVHFCDCHVNGYKVSVRPLLSERTEDFASDVLFTGLNMTQLSEFYVLSVSDTDQTVERVLIIPTEGLPKDREKAVVSSVVSDKYCFYRYVDLLLGNDSILSVLGADRIAREASGTSQRKEYRIPALYEKMLQTAAKNPDKFRGIEYLMKMISKDGTIPEEFKKLYSTFKKAVKLND